MDSTQVGVFRKVRQIGLTCLQQSTNSWPLEAQTCSEDLSSFSHQPLEGKFVAQVLSGLLIMSNFTECRSTRPVMMRFLYPSVEGALLPVAFVSSGFLVALPLVDLWAVCFAPAVEQRPPYLPTFSFGWGLVRQRWCLR